ncbi:hypothetical protein LZ017_15700 [Pelomonas sp. CA6]|uniref:hypothetical protein n=1 Tax=Pelomonas sp. CA6 TaxID=2907999 RepID=UPI001F4BF085|nr:hypothetical protein [Pelomonas sp. CA6]MCH7344824.1 hypothetical protein [Pelomonas sp. CA6]
MFRYTRTVTIEHGAGIAPALQTALELAAYVNKTYGFQISVGTELFGATRVYWYNDIDSLDAVPQFAFKAAADKIYIGLLEKMKAYVLKGSVQDQVVQLIG